jgi:hypothetical protein
MTYEAQLKMKTGIYNALRVVRAGAHDFPDPGDESADLQHQNTNRYTCAPTTRTLVKTEGRPLAPQPRPQDITPASSALEEDEEQEVEEVQEVQEVHCRRWRSSTCRPA